MTLESLIEEFLKERGALAVGIATTETLAGGPPSSDITYRMEGARSAVGFALPLDRDHVRAFLAKQDRVPHEEDNLSTNIRSKDLSWELAEMLKKEGFQAKGTAANMKYRQDEEGWEVKLHPDISHRYIAVRSGLGSFGWSGNVGIKGHGTAIILGTTVTDAELDPTEPIPEEEGFCDMCKLCYKSCALGMFDNKQEMSVTLGGVTFTHAARRDQMLCEFTCGGFNGLARSGKWSTWSPGRFEVPGPEDHEKLLAEFFRAVELYYRRPEMPGGYQHVALGQTRQYMTCGSCQIICWGNREETRENVRLLHSSGCVLQRPDGELYALPAEEARAAFEAMEEERRALYS
ncbi:MAG: epoxyqueuosine reductase [Actinomycetota bacterium]